MASRTLDVKLNATDNMSPAFEKAGNAAKTLGDSLEGLGKGGGLDGFLSQIQSVDSEIRTVGQALTGFGVAVTAGVAVGVKQFADLEAAMANVSTIAGQSDAWIANMTTQIRGLAVELGTSPTGLAEGLYDLIGSGIDSADALDVLRVSAVAAKAGLTDTGTAARAITSVLNAYGLAASEAGDVSDVLFKTVDSGVISFEELSGSLGRALPLANLLSVSIEELGAAYAELTRNGLNASEAETSFTALLTAAINPTEALTEAVREHGYASAEAMIQTEGFTSFLQFLWDVSGGSASAMSELTGNVRATNGALILAQDGASGFTDRLVEMEDASGATSAAFERQMDTINASLARARAGFNDLAITVGAAVAPAIDAGANAMSGWATVLSSLPDGLQTVASIATAAAGGVALFAGGLVLAVPRIAETITALRTLQSAMAAAGVSAAAFAGSVSLIGGALALGAGTGFAIGGFLGEFYVSLREGESVTKAFSDSINILAAAMGELRSGDILGFFDTLINGIQDADGAMEGFNKTLSGFLTEAARQSVLGNDAVAQSLEDMVSSAKFAEGAASARLADAEWLHAQIAIQVEATGQTWAMAEQNVRDSMTLTDAELAVREEALNAIADAYLNPETNRAALSRGFDELDAQMRAGTITADEYTDGLVALAREYGELPNDAGAAKDAIDGLNASVKDGSLALASLFGYDGPNSTKDEIDALLDSEEKRAEAERKLREEQQKAREEWIASALAIGGYDNALSQLNMTGMTGDVGLFAEEWTRANQAMDNTFRVIVGNTNAIIQQVDGIQSWADSLINVQGELGEIDQLLEGGFIDADQYAAAQTAYDGISTSVSNIRNNLLAVQAIQAPFIAEVVAGTEQWAAELRQMPADVQRTTLAFMDLQTVQQAQELITLGNSAAFDKMGDSGKAAFEATIQGALQVNPMLFDVLKTMGIINGTPLDFEVNYDALEGAGSAIDQLTTQVGYLVDTLREIYGLPPIKPEVDMSGVEAATSPGGPLGVLQDMIQGLRDEPVDVPVNVQLGDGTGGAAYMGPSEVAALLGLPESVDVPVNIIPGSAAAGDGTGGASNWRDMLGIPSTVDVPATITPDTSAIDTALAGYENQTIAVDIVIGDNELDSGLMNWGLGGGDGSGGRAGYEGKQVSVDIVLGDNELDTIDEGTYGPITIDVEANTTALAASLATIGLSGAGSPALEIPVTINKDAFWQGMAELDGVMANRPAINVSVTADTAGAIGQLEAVAGAAAAADAMDVAVPVATPGSGEGIGQLVAVAGAAAAADALSVTIPVSVIGAGAAIGALNSVAAAANSIPSSVSTTITTNRVTNNVQTYSTVGAPGGGIYMQHGGIPSYATGGVLFRAAEGNRPEIAHFAGGGTALLPRDGLYMAPPMTYISPNNSSASYGGDTYSEVIELHIHGNVYGIDDLADAMEGALARRRRGYGQAVTA